jgi:hypothetical protein
MFGPIQIFGSGRWRVFGMKHLPCVLSLDFVCRAPPLNHGHEASWLRELFFLVGWLPRSDLLNRGGLVALLHDIRRRIRWWWGCVVGYRARHWLLGAHPLLKCSIETKEFSAFYEKMRGSSHSILVEVRMPWASAVEHLLCRQLRLSSTPLLAWLRVTAATAMIIIPPPR